jgi:hypothetical protein
MKAMRWETCGTGTRGKPPHFEMCWAWISDANANDRITGSPTSMALA